MEVGSSGVEEIFFLQDSVLVLLRTFKKKSFSFPRETEALKMKGEGELVRVNH